MQRISVFEKIYKITWEFKSMLTDKNIDTPFSVRGTNDLDSFKCSKTSLFLRDREKSREGPLPLSTQVFLRSLILLHKNFCF